MGTGYAALRGFWPVGCSQAEELLLVGTPWRIFSSVAALIVVRLNLLGCRISIHQPEREFARSRVTLGRSSAAFVGLFFSFGSPGGYVQGEFQITSRAIHLFSMIWNLPEPYPLLQGGKPFQVGTPLFYKRVASYSAQPASQVHLSAIQGLGQSRVGIIPWVWLCKLRVALVSSLCWEF